MPSKYLFGAFDASLEMRVSFETGYQTFSICASLPQAVMTRFLIVSPYPLLGMTPVFSTSGESDLWRVGGV